jgi:hypothetical protein
VKPTLRCITWRTAFDIRRAGVKRHDGSTRLIAAVKRSSLDAMNRSVPGSTRPVASTTNCMISWCGLNSVTADGQDGAAFPVVSPRRAPDRVTVPDGLVRRRSEVLCSCTQGRAAEAARDRNQRARADAALILAFAAPIQHEPCFMPTVRDDATKFDEHAVRCAQCERWWLGKAHRAAQPREQRIDASRPLEHIVGGVELGCRKRLPTQIQATGKAIVVRKRNEAIGCR